MKNTTHITKRDLKELLLSRLSRAHPKLLLVALLILSASIKAQTLERTVISAAGETLTAGGASISFTAGETLVGNVAENAAIDQGFWAVTYQTANLSINEAVILKADMTAFPNPVTDQLTIISDTERSYTISIYDIAGRMVHKEDQLQATRSKTLDVSKLSSGIFLVTLSTLEGQALKTIKIIKK